ncbi:MAG: DNA-binding protein WhiA [Lachnospiraceae bacterium]|nr:DNA-binding protein WhiA [Lachnospiraceae bacterium]
MSFSSDVRQEISTKTDRSEGAKRAEAAALLKFGAQRIELFEDAWTVFIHREYDLTLKKCFTLLPKTFKIGTNAVAHEIYLSANFPWEEYDVTNEKLLSSADAKRAFIRGAFMACGSVTDPEKSYHLEFVLHDDAEAELMKGLLGNFGLEARTIHRKGHPVVYLKESAAISDVLNICGAHVSLMKLENDRIMKEMRNSVNRKVNCETANLDKTVDAANRQLEEIKTIREEIGLENLPDNLREIAMLRLQNPECTLQELGELLDPPVGKSGVNHRFRKLGEIARQLGTGTIKSQ